MFGSHLSIAGGLHHALERAQELGFESVQIFTKNQRQWAAPPLRDEQVDLWRQCLKQSKLRQPVSHDSYLINLASPDRANREKSIRLFIDEVERCEALDIPWLVAHPGAHMGAGEAVGLRRIARALDRVHKTLPGYRTVTCLENTAGQGTSLGWRFEHLNRIRELVREPRRIGICIDTAHALAAGYDLTSAAGARATLRELDDVAGWSNVRVIHVNDSKTALGSRVDRHAHIGHGHISVDAFGVIVRKARRLPKILETPKEDAPDGRPWDLINVERLRGLMKSAVANRRKVGR
jgi:deoxyribonuclease-4